MAGCVFPQKALAILQVFADFLDSFFWGGGAVGRGVV